MLRLKQGMLVPDGTQDSLIDFMASQRAANPAHEENSKERFMILCENETYSHEGYLVFHSSGELRVRANSIAYSRQLHMYAWDRVVAMIPCNKQVKAHWLHPDILTKHKTLTFRHTWHKQMIESRLQPLIIKAGV